MARFQGSVAIIEDVSHQDPFGAEYIVGGRSAAETQLGPAVVVVFRVWLSVSVWCGRPVELAEHQWVESELARTFGLEGAVAVSTARRGSVPLVDT